MVASHRDLIGFGIDEGTTLVVSPRTGRVRVLGDSYVLACTADRATGGARFDFLKAGDETDLGGLRRPDGVIACPIDLEDSVGRRRTKRRARLIGRYRHSEDIQDVRPGLLDNHR